MNRFQIVSAKEALWMAQSEEYIVVDLRDYSDYVEGHLENALSIPNADFNDIKSLGNQNNKWLLYCTRGNLSFQLAARMAKNGYYVYAVRGNIKSVL